MGILASIFPEVLAVLYFLFLIYIFVLFRRLVFAVEGIAKKLEGSTKI